jgi:hypothetical protein
MDKSSIYLHPPNAPVGRMVRDGRLSGDLEPAVREAIGHELRRRRMALQLSQGAVGHPLTRSYVSAVELGHAVPSLPALRLMASRLGLSLSEFFAAVEVSMSTET